MFTAIQTQISKRRAACAGLLSIALAGCGGGGGDDQIPPGASVMIEPASFDWDIAQQPSPCIINPGFYQDSYFSVRVLNAAGSPIGEVPLMITVDFTGNTFSGTPVLELYEDRNGNGVADGPSELVSDTNDPIFRTSTARYTGEKYLIVRTNLSCPYQGNIQVFAYGVSGIATIDVNDTL